MTTYITVKIVKLRSGSSWFQILGKLIIASSNILRWTLQPIDTILFWILIDGGKYITKLKQIIYIVLTNSNHQGQVR